MFFKFAETVKVLSSFYFPSFHFYFFLEKRFICNGMNPRLPDTNSFVRLFVRAKRQEATMRLVLSRFYIFWRWHDRRDEDVNGRLPSAVSSLQRRLEYSLLSLFLFFSVRYDSCSRSLVELADFFTVVNVFSDGHRAAVTRRRLCQQRFVAWWGRRKIFIVFLRLVGNYVNETCDLSHQLLTKRYYVFSLKTFIVVRAYKSQD